jgi:2-dehydro-3-deoxyphosphogluconate aldolase / (4S)-4-hydroxy-2-oxoglutarate aldolase
MQQIPFAIFKKQYPSAATGRPFRLWKLNASFFKFRFCRIQRIYAQSDMTKTRQFIVRRVRQRFLRGIDFKTGIPERDEIHGRFLAIIENDPGAKHPLIPVFQSHRVPRHQRNMFNGDIHLKAADYEGIGFLKIKSCSFSPSILYPVACKSMNTEPFLKQRLICVAVIDQPDAAVPLARALQAGGLNCIEVTFRTAGAAESIARIRKEIPQMTVGAGTLLSADNVKQAVDAGAQFGVSPGLSEAVSKAAHDSKLPLFPGVITPTEVMRAMELGWKHLKFFPAETFGGVNALKALAGPFGHTGVKFIPTGGITAAMLLSYLALPQVAAIGGSWKAERKLIAEKDWAKITELTAEAMKVIATVKG